MASHPEFDQNTGAMEVAKAFEEQVRGKTALVVGVSPQSLGESITLSLASQNPAHLILASRTRSKLEEIADQVKKSGSTARVSILVLDLGSQKDVERAAKEISGLTDRLDIMINNAGLCVVKREFTPEGIELQFGANHIGPFLLTNLLTPLLLRTARSPTTSPGSVRVVNVTSQGHRLCPIRFHDYNFDGKDIPAEERWAEGLPPSLTNGRDGEFYPGFIAYGQSKTANVLFAVELTERLGKEGVMAYAVHPGSIETSLSRNLDTEGQATIANTSTFWKNLDQGGATILVAALDPALSKPNPESVYLSDCQLEPPAPHASDPAAAKRLWDLSEELVGRKFGADKAVSVM
ncbi:hypothetical protein BDY21DRAFT_330937 [Lineolata rhizophorae]|uniref:Short-chain dehydrogenase n=1 Tax=Lineolata rhizophorae TaxID=578093 RepID=A0A6A6PE66_9PEZI|nr:hypothetical protein BDY21DRAFT_330937 [Lineolata rhizophorae]